ncbi:hypothetical protein L249_7584 [Ophiocordyceps polyrhachis-furcata BCC 54312]|uniref:Vacuolar protein sorting-associated protein 51 homolog n=1 Tax=Ophiocordyceps polyrhachis-furcata BCC 54312 TaxID=1330021 RepID=A0A367L9V5_9HYPO|nr:hypothetical protein L249_7584 [Ophiocordyceps polyrhachis-furcata BCC 54312]
MSTIASPREPPPRRLPSSTLSEGGLNNTSTPASPAQGPAKQPQQQQQQQPSRSNRAALREYYNLSTTNTNTSPPRIDVPDSEVPTSDLDAADLDAVAYVDALASRSGIETLLRLYTRVVAEVRALEAEKKALVYDNYSKLISATETIRKVMRASMDPLKPLASTLDPVITQIYSQASSIRESLRESMPAPESEEAKARARRRRSRLLAIEVLATPQRLRLLVRDGREDEARRQWELPRRLLLTWRDKGVGGDDVQTCIDQGDAVFGQGKRPDEPTTRET